MRDGFLCDSELYITCAGLAQLVEQLICNQWVGGSNPSSGTTPTWYIPHAFVLTILLRVSRFNALNINPESQPPDRQSAQAKQRFGTGERHAVVCSNRIWQAKLFEGLFKYGVSIGFFGR